MELIESINLWAGIATILTFAFAIIGYSTKSYKKIIIKAQEQEEVYTKISKEIKNLASKGTSLQKRQDIFIYVTSSLSQGRHTELRLRHTENYYFILSSILVFMTCSTFFRVLTIFRKTESNDYIYLAIAFVIMLLCTIYFMYSYFRLSIWLDHFSKANDAYGKAFTDEIAKHINV